MLFKSLQSRFILFYIFLFFFGYIESQSSFTCNVHSSLIPLVDYDYNSLTNCTNAPQNTTQQCSSIQACLNYFNGLDLSSKDKISIYLTNTKYDAEGNCNLVIKYPITLFLSSSISLNDGSLVNCGFSGSFITALLSSLVINGIGIENAVNTAIVVPQQGATTVLAVSGGYFYNNTGENGGAIHSSYPNTLSLLNTTFSYNTALNGGAIYAQNAGIVQSIFSYNTAVHGGGAIFCNEVYLRSSILDSNVAAQGGAINTDDMNVAYTTFKNNSATQGGALYVTSIYGALISLSDNTAKQGGAIFLSGSNSSNAIHYSTITQNSAEIEGGGLFIGSCSLQSCLDLSHSKVLENSAGTSGGAIFLNYTSPSYIINGTIENNWIVGESSKGDNSQDTSPYQEIGCDGSPGSNCNLCSIEQLVLSSSDNYLQLLDASSLDSNSGGNSSSNSSSSNENSSGSLSGSASGSGGSSSSNDTSSSSHGTPTPPISNNCTQCKKLGGNCIYQNNSTFCLMPKLCWHGQCSISLQGQYSCVCHSGYFNDQCTGSNSSNNNNNNNDNNSTSPKNKKLMRALEISLPIVFGLLIALFLVTLYFMIRKKKSKIPYEPLN